MAARWSFVEGDIRSYERTRAATQGVYLRDPPRGPALGAALYPRFADHQRGQRRRHAERGARGARRRGAEGGLRLVFVRVRPISPYGVSKLAAEQHCMGLNAALGIEVAATLSAGECRRDGLLSCSVVCGSSHTVHALARPRAEALRRRSRRGTLRAFVSAGS